MSCCDHHGNVRGDDGRYQLSANLERVCVCGCTLGVHASEPPYDCLEGDCDGCDRFRDAHAKLSDAMRWALITTEPMIQGARTVAALVERGLAEWWHGPCEPHSSVRPWGLTPRGERVRDYLLATVAAANAASEAGAR